MESNFIQAVEEARAELHHRNYNPEEAVIYCHPVTLRETKDEMDFVQPFKQGAEVYGMHIEATQNIPENVVMAAHPDAGVLGPDSIAFATIDDE